MKAQDKKLSERIQKIKEELLVIGEMRPGSLSKQYNVCGRQKCRCKDPKNPLRHGPYYQLSYVHQGKSTSQFIKKEFLADTQRQIRNFKLFKKLTQDWVDLALQQARHKLDLGKKKIKKSSQRT